MLSMWYSKGCITTLHSSSPCISMKLFTIVLQVFHGQPLPSPVPAAPHPPAMRPRVRARRGQATDPHSIAERVSPL